MKWFEVVSSMMREISSSHLLIYDAHDDDIFVTIQSESGN